MKTRNWFALALCIIVLLVAGCTDSTPVFDNSSKPAQIGKVETIPTKRDSMRITVYHATKDALNLVPEIHVVDKNDHPAWTAVALLASEPIDKNLIRIMPVSTKLLGLKIQNGIAYPNFSANISRFGGGSANEILLVAAIVNTLTEFPQIKQVQILIDGKKHDTLAGHIDISEPLGRTEKIIKQP